MSCVRRTGTKGFQEVVKPELYYKYNLMNSNRNRRHTWVSRSFLTLEAHPSHIIPWTWRTTSASLLWRWSPLEVVEAEQHRNGKTRWWWFSFSSCCWMPLSLPKFRFRGFKNIFCVTTEWESILVGIWSARIEEQEDDDDIIQDQSCSCPIIILALFLNKIIGSCIKY